MQLSTIYTDIEAISNVTSQRALVKRAVQYGLNELTNAILPYLNDESFFTTVAPYETGTVTATNASKTITGSGTTFTAAMVGRKIRVDDQIAYYRIAAYVSATEVTLEAPYQGTTGSSLTYSIYKDEYKLRADVDVYKVLRQIEEGIALGSVEASAFDIIDPSPQAEGTPRFEVMVGTKLDTNTTGTLSGTVNQKTLTGSSTTWLSVEGLSRGTKITIGEYVYTIKSVDSDTSMTIYEPLVTTPSGSSFTLLLRNMIVLVKDIPDTAQNIYYRYQRLPFPLISDSDVPDLPEKFHHLLIRYGLSWVWMSKDKDEATKQSALAEKGRAEMWRQIGQVSTSRIYRRISMDVTKFVTRTGQPVAPANYGLPLEL